MQQQAMNDTYLQSTVMLDYTDLRIQKLILSKDWHTGRSSSAIIEAVYSYVRDDILYGYASAFDTPASKVLTLGYGNCLTKTTLLMALLRAVGIPCRLRAGTVSRVLFRGLLPATFYHLSERVLYHSQVELFFNKKWVSIGGHIVDYPYLLRLQEKFPDHMGTFLGYGIAVTNFRNPPVKWEESETSIQTKALIHDLGTFDDPDSLFKAYPQIERMTEKFVYKRMIMPLLNKSIERLREGKDG